MLKGRGQFPGQDALQVKKLHYILIHKNILETESCESEQRRRDEM